MTTRLTRPIRRALATIVAGAALALAGCGGDGGSDGPAQPTASDIQLPAQKTASLKDATAAAGCVVEHPKVAGEALHETRVFAARDFNSNPPTSGVHHPQWYEDGVYAPGAVPDLGQLVHTLEHGRIDLQYKTGTPEKTVQQLEALVAEMEGGYHVLLFENTTNMKYQVAATAWGQLVGCNEMNDQVFDVIRTFRNRYIDKGPEAVP